MTMIDHKDPAYEGYYHDKAFQAALRAYGDLRVEMATSGHPPHSDYWCQSDCEAQMEVWKHARASLAEKQ